MLYKWQASKFKGVRYRLHPTRKHGIMPDRYYVIRYQIDGLRQEESLGWSSDGVTESGAALKLKELKRAAKDGSGVGRLREERHRAQEELEKKEEERKVKEAEEVRKKKEEVTFGEMFEVYLAWAKTEKKHWDNDEYRYKCHIKEHLHNRPMKDIGNFFLSGVKSSLKSKGLADASVRHCMAIIRQVFNKAILWGKWDHDNPTKGLKFDKLDNAKERVITHDEESKLLKVLKEKSVDVHDMAMVSLYAGLRFAEIANLRWQNIQWHMDLITVEGKGGKVRTVPMCQQVKVILKARRRDGSFAPALIFPDRKGNVQKKISATYPREVNDLGLNDGMDKRFRLDFHSLRHSYATRLASQGTPLYVLRDLLGHADLQMVSRYSHYQPSQAGQIKDILNGFAQKESNVVDLKTAKK